MTNTPTPEFISAFAEVAEFTRPKCGECRAPHCCCSDAICNDVEKFARDQFGIELPHTGNSVRFLSGEGCTVAPHLRPLCSVHVCEMHLMGPASDPDWIDRYYELREKAEDALFNEVEQE